MNSVDLDTQFNDPTRRADDSPQEQDKERAPEEDIDVKQSVAEFDTLSRDLDAQIARDEVLDPQEVENGNPNKFDIREYFEDSVRRNEQSGHTIKRMGVYATDLTVIGESANTTSIPDNLSPLKYLAKLLWPPNWIKRHKEDNTFNILTRLSFLCKDGEMLLVLGRPGSGCSTLLRVIANNRATYVDVQGNVFYGGIPAEEFSEYRGESIYVPEEDYHFPIMSLRDTLQFALKTKTPGHRLPDESKRQFRDRVFDSLVKMFGLTNQVNTLVGNEYVPGLSGGERKRCTIAEAMVSQGTIINWDCSTRGLDAASALNYAKSLRVMTDTLKKTTVVSLYQASEAIYELFDRVIVLDKGRCTYCGPTKDAKRYFMGLGFDCEPRKSTPDFLTGVTNPQERIFQPGKEHDAPKTSLEFEEAWLASQAHTNLIDEIDEYKRQVEVEKPSTEFVAEVERSKGKRARTHSKYQASVFAQTAALLRRQSQLVWNNKFGLVSRYFSVLVQSFIYGSVFFQLPLTAIGGFTRGGALFTAILFNAFLSQAELPNTFFGRNVLQKHNSYAMYHPAAYHIAQVIMDVPVILIQNCFFSIIVYFMFGLDPNAGKFFLFVTILFITSMTITNFFRLLGNLSPSMFLSQQALSAILVLLLTYCGFYIPRYKQRPYFAWIYWVDPIAYAFKALYSNEMRGLVFDCSQVGAVPSGPAYTDPAYKVCILPGAVPGETTVRAEVFLQYAYGFNTNDLGMDIGILICFFFGYTALNIIATEFLNFVHGGYTKKVYKHGNAPKENDAEAELVQAKIVEEATADLGSKLETRKSVFTWDSIKYTVKVKDGERQLLDNVEGWIKPGQMTALMGASGAGKTTLLDVLAQRKTQGRVEGTMLLNGLPLRIDFERITGYAEQLDVHNPYLTVREALRFSARLRQEKDVPEADKMAYVEQVLDMMEMREIGDALIGDAMSGTGISVEEKKRLTIGLELVAKPHILFLDEPTSGLDSQSAYNIVKFVRKLADAGMPLVCTIHQPSSVLFEYFDRILLLGKGGKIIYFGDIGDKSRIMLDYFEGHGARPCSESENPAEYILEAIGAGVGGYTDKDWVQVWRESPECTAVHEELAEIKAEAANNKEAANQNKGKPREFATGFFTQFYLLMLRMTLVFWRNPFYNTGRLIQAIVVGLVIGFSFYKLGDSTSDLQLKILAIFQIIILGILLVIAAMPQFHHMRELFRRDYSSKFYSYMPFALVMILVELPYLTVAASICVLCTYFAVPFNQGTVGDGFYFWIFFVLFMWFCVSFGQLIATLSPNVAVAMIIMPIFTTILFLFCGVLAPPSTLPYFWRSWMYPLDPFHYFMEGIITSVLTPLKIVCNERDFYKFYPPINQTCGTYMEAFFAAGNSGYLLDPSATDVCNYCQYKSGEEYYRPYGWSVSHKWRNFGILLCYWFANIMLSCVFVYVFRKQKR